MPRTTPLGAAVVHAVTNPLDQITAAIHVYGGDFFATPLSEWDPESFEERPYDVEVTIRAFQKANERLREQAPIITGNKLQLPRQADSNCRRPERLT